VHANFQVELSIKDKFPISKSWCSLNAFLSISSVDVDTATKNDGDDCRCVDKRKDDLSVLK
jgi:hypothetical protein